MSSNYLFIIGCGLAFLSQRTWQKASEYYGRYKYDSDLGSKIKPSAFIHRWHFIQTLSCFFASIAFFIVSLVFFFLVHLFLIPITFLFFFLSSKWEQLKEKFNIQFLRTRGFRKRGIENSVKCIMELYLKAIYEGKTDKEAKMQAVSDISHFTGSFGLDEPLANFIFLALQDTDLAIPLYAKRSDAILATNQRQAEVVELVSSCFAEGYTKTN